MLSAELDRCAAQLLKVEMHFINFLAVYAQNQPELETLMTT
jgi:hypothetical protein